MSRTIHAILGASLCLLSSHTNAGPLTPPSGPVASTSKQIAEIEPRIAINATNTPGTATGSFRINQPGSYYLTGNFTGVAGKAGIEVNCNNVTIDLNGFTLQGVAGSSGGILSTSSATRGIVVRNGIVRDWGGSGVDFGNGSSVAGSVIENILAVANGSFGIRCGYAGLIRDCTATDHTAAAAIGIVAYNQSVIERCTAYSNRLGISIGAGAVAVDCASSSNTSVGYSIGANVALHRCMALSNTSHGFSQNSGTGVVGLTFDHCQSLTNTGDGFSVISAIFLECVASGNGAGAGVGAGIRISAVDSRVDGCSLLNNDSGLVVGSAGGAFIVRNTASGNATANYALLGTNTVGPIITATGTITSTSPWANFEY